MRSMTLPGRVMIAYYLQRTLDGFKSSPEKDLRELRRLQEGLTVGVAPHLRSIFK